MSLDGEQRFITFADSETSLDLNTDFPDGKNKKEGDSKAILSSTLKGVKAEVIKNLDFLTVLENYRTLAFENTHRNFQPSHRYKRLKKIFDEEMLPLRRVLQYHEISIVEEDRSGTKFMLMILGEKIAIEPLSWDSILVDGKKYNLFEEYIEEILRKRFYEDDDIEDIGVGQRAFFKISETIKNKLGIEYEGDYYLCSGCLVGFLTYGYIAIPGELRDGYVTGYNRCVKDQWDIDQFNYNFGRKRENRSYFIEQVDFDKALLST